MQHKKRNILTASKENGEAVKPLPPDDLWQQIDAALAEVGEAPRPANSFTRSEFQALRGVTESSAKRHIGKLIKAGKVRAVNDFNRRYYVLVKP